jgi:hypothetical protein
MGRILPGFVIEAEVWAFRSSASLTDHGRPRPCKVTNFYGRPEADPEGNRATVSTQLPVRGFAALTTFNPNCQTGRRRKGKMSTRPWQQASQANLSTLRGEDDRAQGRCASLC